MAPLPIPVQAALIVETSVLIRASIAEYLRECGYKVYEAVSSDEALIILTEGNAAIDIVLSDVQISGALDGFGLARWIRNNRPTIKTLLAGTPAKASEIASDLCETGPLMTKPYDKQLLLDRIKRLLAKSSDP